MFRSPRCGRAATALVYTDKYRFASHKTQAQRRVVKSDMFGNIISVIAKAVMSNALARVKDVVRNPPSALHCACLANDADKVHAALRACAYFGDGVNVPLFRRRQSDFLMPLHLAPANYTIVRELLAHGADINAQTVCVGAGSEAVLDDTALTLSARTNDATAIVKLLLESKADPTIKSRNGTPLEVCARSFYEDISMSGGRSSMASLCDVAHTLVKSNPLVAREVAANGAITKYVLGAIANSEAALGHMKQFDFVPARRWMRMLVVCGADVAYAPVFYNYPDEVWWHRRFWRQVCGFTRLHWAVADQRPDLVAKYLPHEDSDPMRGTTHDSYCTAYSLGLRPAAHPDVVVSTECNPDVVHLLENAMLPWCPQREALWPRSFSHMMYFVSLVVSSHTGHCGMNVVAHLARFLERADARNWTQGGPSYKRRPDKKRRRHGQYVI